MPSALYEFTPESLSPLEATYPNFTTVDFGTVISSVAEFDDTVEEYLNGSFVVHPNITTGTVTFRVHATPKTAAASKNVEVRFGHRAVDHDEATDGSYTNIDSGDLACINTQDDMHEWTFTETVTNLGWAAGDRVFFRISRIAPSANNLGGDLRLFSFAIEIPVTT